jgi:hypothetical protein
LKPVFGIGGAEWLILMVAGLFILGPERLPSAATCFTAPDWSLRSLSRAIGFCPGAVVKPAR